MHYYFAEWATLMAIFLIAAITPGADLAMVLRQSLVHGRKNAIVTSFGIGSALLFHVSYTILGLGLIISKSIFLFNVVKWLGVAYLFYIGFRALTSGGSTATIAESGAVKPLPQSLKKAFLLGFVVNVLNPKAVFFFLSIFSTLVAATTPMSVKFGYGLSMSFLLIIWFTLVSVFMTAPLVRAAFYKASKWIDRVSGAVFIALGVRLMFQKAS
ncbi:LysE family transporter [Bartonella sp. LJL80]